MARIDDLLAEYKELKTFEYEIITRIWDTATEATDLKTGVPLNEANVKARVNALAEQLVNDYPRANPVLVGLLDGAVPFASLLCVALKKLDYKFKYTSMSASSYGNEMVSGALQIGALPKADLVGEHVIILDDVCDSGKTLKALIEAFKAQYAAEVQCMVLVNKNQDHVNGITPDYAGFELSKEAFIVGMGLDYRQEMRMETSIRAVVLASLPNDQEKEKLARLDDVLKQIKEIAAQKQAVQLNNHSIFKPSVPAPAQSSPQPASMALN